MNVPTCKKTKTHHSLLTRQASSSKSRGNQCSSIMKLPENVIAHILSYLPVKSLLLFKCVSRLWCSLIESEYFIKLHLRNFVHDSSGAKLGLILQDTCFLTPKIFSVADVGSRNECVELGGGPFGYRTRLLGSCNGLLYVCQSDMEDSVQYKRSGKYYVSPKIALWNPLTKKSHILPFAPIQVTSWSPLFGILDSLKVQYAFGNDSINDDYKVLRIVQQINPGMTDPDKFNLKTIVYSLKADSWREIVAPSYLHYIVSRESVLIREAFHWLPIQGHGLNIVAFDIRREEYCTVPLPNLESKSSPCYRNLGVLRQCLSLASSSVHNVEIWVMKEYGMKDSWVKLLLLDQSSSLCYRTVPYDLTPLAFVKDCNDDLKVLLKWMYDQSLIWYDLKLKTYENVQIRGAPWLYQSYIFVGSLVSPLPPIIL
ncbi:hypothetical protein SADUNF_Sadunf16G0016700 [Salix dunnii]|uniref:F-box domain-containing protein n=1 Tax=Salix dunnii TaxID=1413687 RepID=A0A835MKM1_9ROSI|nr:hypothetical protein SADUNF_Sadunf16G0016700 [Salix dunnii]